MSHYLKIVSYLLIAILLITTPYILEILNSPLNPPNFSGVILGLFFIYLAFANMWHFEKESDTHSTVQRLFYLSRHKKPSRNVVSVLILLVSAIVQGVLAIRSYGEFAAIFVIACHVIVIAWINARRMVWDMYLSENA